MKKERWLMRRLVRGLVPATLFISFLVVAGLSRGQHMLFHLLGAGQLEVNFTSTSQTVAEGTGTWSSWPSGLSAWTKRREIRLEGQSGALSNFPVLIKLNSARIDYSAVQDSGQDLRFTDSSGNLLLYEIENWNEAGTSTVWVRVPTISAYPAANSVWMYYGNAAASDAQSASTWDASFAKVLHLNGAAGSISNGASVLASVGVAATANSGGSGMSYATGQVANGVTFDGTDDWIAIGSDAGLNFGANSPFTFSVFFKTTDTTGPIVSFRDAATGANILGLHIGYNGATTQSGKINLIVGNTTTGYAQLVGPTVNDNAWHYLVVSRNSGSTISLYVDGVSYGTASVAGSGSAITTDLRAIGSERKWVAAAFGTANDQYFAGAVDDLQISTSQRSVEWNQMTYLSARDELATFGSEETPLTGAAVIAVQLSSPAESTVTIPYTVSGTATAGTDHSRVNGSLVINGGSSSGSLNTYILRDDLVEGSETAILTLGAPTGAALGINTVHTVTITDEVLSPPDAIDDSVNLTTLGAVTIPVLANDTDVNGDVLTITSFTSPSSGTVARVAQQLIYTPNGDFGATDSFTYTISDGRGGSDTATVTLNYQIPFTWIGSGADANWTTAANWLGGVVPGASDTVYFNNQCTTYCDPTVVANVSVGGLRINTSYGAGVIVMGTHTLTVGTGGFTQRAGTFNGGTAQVNVTGAYVLSGGTFTSTTDTLQVSNTFTISGGTFTHNSGTLRFENSASGGQNYAISLLGTISVNHLQFSGGEAGSMNCKTWTIQSGGFDVLGNFRFGRTTGGALGSILVDGGTISVKGNIVVDPANLTPGNSGYASGGGSTVLLVNGTGSQTFSAAAAGSLPSIEVNKSSGSFGPADGTSNSFLTTSLTLTAGSFTAPAGSLTVAGSFTRTSGTFAPNGGTLVFDNFGKGSGGATLTTAGALSVHHLSIGGGFGGSSYSWTWTLSAGSSFSAAGNLSLARSTGTGTVQINSGSIDFAGHLSAASSFGGGTTVLTASGTAAQNLSQSTATIPGSVFTVNKASGTIAQTAATTFSTSGQDLTLTSGTYNMAGFALAVADVLTIASGAKLICSGGTVTYGSAVINGEISCGPTLGITWTGLAGDGLWTTAGNWTNNTIPGASDIAYFNGGSCAGANCNATVNSAMSVKGLVMASSYTGTLTQSNTMTIGTSGWTVAGGTFAGGSSSISVSGAFALSGGTFTATSGAMTTSSTYTVSGSPTFNHNSGTLYLSTSGSGTTSITPGSVTYYNVTFGGHQVTFNLSGTMTVNGLLTLDDVYSSGGIINTGTIVASGNVSFTGYGKAGSGLVKIAGTGNQTVTGVATSNIPNFEIASTGGTVTLAGSLLMKGNYTVTSGTVDASASSITFSGSGSTTVSMIPGSVEYNNVTFAGNQVTFNITGTMTVNGLLLFNDPYSGAGNINTGTIVAKGDVTFSNYGKGAGTGLLKIAGSGNQTLTGAASANVPSIEIASTGGIVSFSGTLYIRKNYTYTSGTVDAGTSTLSLTAYDSTTANVTPGPVNYNNVTFSGAATTFNLTGTMAVYGTLTVTDGSSGVGSINGGTINAYGPVSFSSYGKLGSVAIRIVGSSSQTITGVASAYIPSFEIASSGGTVTLSGTLVTKRSYTYTSGTVDAGTSTLTFSGGDNSVVTTVPGPIVYNNVTFTGAAVTFTLTGTLTVNGVLTFADGSSGTGSVNTGSIVANGNVVFSSYGKVGTAPLEFQGATNSTLNVGSSANRLRGLITVNKSGGASVTLLSDIAFSTAGQDVTVSGGTLDLGGYLLTVADVLTVGAGTTLYCNGGEFTPGSLVNSGTVNCPGYAGYGFNWTGAAADSNFSTPGNWSGGVAPTATSVVVFNDTHCGANCSANLSGATSIKGIQMQSPYTGTISQGTGNTLTVGTRGWTQAAGTFVGGNSSISSAGPFALSGGSFTSTSSTLTLNRNFTISGSPIFTHSSGTVIFDSPAGLTATLTPGTVAFNHVTFQARYSNFTLSGTMTVNGNLTLQDTDAQGYSVLNNGTINLSGNLTSNTNGLTGALGSATWVRLVGSGNQTVTGTAVSSRIPRFEIASTGGVVTFVGTPAFRNHFLYTSGTVDAGTSTASFFNNTGTTSITPGPIVFNNVTFSGMNATFTLTGSMYVGGTLTLADSQTGTRQINTGTLVARGNVVFSANGYAGTASLTFDGTAATTVNVAGAALRPTGLVTVNRTGGGSVTLTSAVSFNGATQDLTISAGTLDMAGYALTIGRNITNSGTLKRGNNPSCGTLSYGGTYTGNAAVCP